MKADRELVSFAGLIHFPSAHVAALFGVLTSAAIILIYPNGGEQRTISGQLTGEPIWFPEIAAGVLSGMFLHRRFPSRFAFIAWLPQAVFLLYSAISWQKTMAVHDSTWDTHFGRDCGGSECLYELFLTTPFYAGVGHAVGALLSRIFRVRVSLS